MVGHARLFIVTAMGSFVAGLLVMGPLNTLGQVGPFAASAWEQAKSFAQHAVEDPATIQPASSSPGPGCNPNYSGACVPVARDVDCAGKGGDGPAFVEGPFEVVGEDVYQLDADGDGIACEPFRR
jgi:hypothetical protein